MDDDTEVYWSCSSLLNGELFVFGGDSTSNRRKQVKLIPRIYPITKTLISRCRKLLAVNLNGSVT